MDYAPPELRRRASKRLCRLIPKIDRVEFIPGFSGFYPWYFWWSFFPSKQADSSTKNRKNKTGNPTGQRIKPVAGFTPFFAHFRRKQKCGRPGGKDPTFFRNSFHVRGNVESVLSSQTIFAIGLPLPVNKNLASGLCLGRWGLGNTD